MIKRLLCSKLFVVFISILIIGFFVGYDYIMIISRPDKVDNTKPTQDMTSKSIQKDTDYESENRDLGNTQNYENTFKNPINDTN